MVILHPVKVFLEVCWMSWSYTTRGARLILSITYMINPSSKLLETPWLDAVSPYVIKRPDSKVSKRGNLKKKKKKKWVLGYVFENITILININHTLAMAQLYFSPAGNPLFYLLEWSKEMKVIIFGNYSYIVNTHCWLSSHYTLTQNKGYKDVLQWLMSCLNSQSTFTHKKHLHKLNFFPLTWHVRW